MLPGANRGIPRDGWRVSGSGTERRANPAGRIKGHFPGAPSDTSEGPRQASGRNARLCLFGHNPILRQIRDGTPGKTCGTDQRRVPDAPSDISEGPRQAGLGTERQAKPAGRIKGDFRTPLLIQVRAPAGLGVRGRNPDLAPSVQKVLPFARNQLNAGNGKPASLSACRCCSVARA